MLTVDMRNKWKKKNYNVYLMGDIHIGRIGVAYKKLQEAIDIILADKGAAVCLMGDLVECIAVGDPRYNPDEMGGGKYKRMTEQCKDAADLLRPIKSRIISILQGNHEEKVGAYLNGACEIAERLGLDIQTGSRTNILKLSDNVKFYLTHGNGGGSSKAGDPEQIERNEAIGIKRRLRFLRADCCLMAMGHVHKLRICKPIQGLCIVDGKECYPEVYVDPVTGAIEENKRWYCSTGSFVKGYLEGVDTYVERAGYAPTQLGLIRAVVKNDKLVDVQKVIL